MGAIGVSLILTAIALFFVVIIRAMRLVIKREKAVDKRTLKFLIAAALVAVIGGALIPGEEGAQEKTEKIKEAVKDVEAEEKESTKENVGKISDDEEISEKDENKEIEESEEVSTLPYTVDEFREKFDVAAEEFGLFFRSNKTAEIVEGQVNNTQQVVTASDYVNIFATLNKNNEVLSINLIGVGDGTTDSGVEIMATIGATIAASQPELSPDERGDILKDLGLIGDEEIGDDMATTTRGKFTYSLSINDVTGVMFFVEPAR